MRAVRDVAIIALLALGVAVLPGGGAAAEAVLAALFMGFLVAMGFFAYRFYMENQLTISTLRDSQRAVLYGAFGVIALMIAGADELLNSGVGTLVWIGLLGLSGLAIFRIWSEASSY